MVLVLAQDLSGTSVRTYPEFKTWEKFPRVISHDLSMRKKYLLKICIVSVFSRDLPPKPQLFEINLRVPWITSNFERCKKLGPRFWDRVMPFPNAQTMCRSKFLLMTRATWRANRETLNQGAPRLREVQKIMNSVEGRRLCESRSIFYEQSLRTKKYCRFFNEFICRLSLLTKKVNHMRMT